MRHRPDIDGLRGIAILGVMAFHAEVLGVTGGYAGVDVFFVISGYLIAGMITEELGRGSFSYRGFYERRVRRLVPALLVVLLATLVGALLWFPAILIPGVAAAAAATAAFGANFHFWHAAGYFAPGSHDLPLIQMWSLGVEEQFYLCFPFLLVACWRSPRWRTPLLVALALLSFGLAEWGTHHAPVASFYLLPTRAWELLLGACCVSAGGVVVRVPHGWRIAFRWAALAAVIAPLFFYDPATPFPGRYALVPALGTAFLIVSGGSERAMLDRLLESRILTGIGLISYSAYLWHQPILVFARYQRLATIGTGEGLALCALGLALAYLTWRTVERPFRDPGRVTRSRLYPTVILGGAGVFALAGVLYLGHGTLGRVRYPASVVTSFTRTTPRTDPCLASIEGEALGCGFGPRDSAVKVIVVGDSHAAALLPAFEAIGGDGTLSGRLVATPSCSPFVSSADPIPGQGARCALMNAGVLAFVRRHHVPHVVLVARWESVLALRSGPQAGAAEVFRADLERTIAAYHLVGADVTVMRQVPRQQFTPLRIYAAVAQEGGSEAPITRVAPTLAEYRAEQATVLDAFNAQARRGMLHLAGVEEALCTPMGCPVGTSSGSRYSDADHVSVAGALFVGPTLGRQLAAAGIR